jgi:DNA-binding MarR family transcriptional regulator
MMYNLTQTNYLQTIQVIEKLSKALPEAIRKELENLGVFDIAGVQAMLLYRINDQSVHIGEVTKHRFYQGTNPTYNLKQLIKNGYLTKSKDCFDARSSFVCLSEKGRSLWEVLDRVIVSQANILTSAGIDDNNIREILFILNKINDTLPLDGKK